MSAKDVKAYAGVARAIAKVPEIPIEDEVAGARVLLTVSSTNPGSSAKTTRGPKAATRLARGAKQADADRRAARVRELTAAEHTNREIVAVLEAEYGITLTVRTIQRLRNRPIP